MLFDLFYQLGGVDGARGANISASTAVCAEIGVDRIDVAFADSTSGTFVDAGTACNAVVTNYVSHSVCKFKMLCIS